MSRKDNFRYKAMDWYDLLGFNRNYMNESGLSYGEYCAKHIEVAYQNCLRLLDCNDLAEINLFYKIPSLNYCAGKIENLTELREKIQEAYNTLRDPQRRKEYEFEIFGIFSCEYPNDENADQKFKDRTIYNVELEKKFELDRNSYWTNCLSLDYWKNWRENIKSLRYKEEINFYITKYSSLRMFILKSTGWKEEKISTNVLDLIKQEEKKLQNMSKEEWDKGKKQPSRDGELREMSVEEISKMLGKFLPTYGWNFNEEYKKEPGENYGNILPKSKNKLIQWMKKNHVEEISSENNNLICKDNKGNLVTSIPYEENANAFNINLLLLDKTGGKKSISRQELENELNTIIPEKMSNNSFSLIPWLIAGGLLVLVSVLFFKTRKHK